MTTSSVTLPAGVNAYTAQTATAATGSNSLGATAAELQNNFMKLLLTQIQNQDPLNPQDPAQMTSQLSQLNMVSSLQNISTSVDSMLSQIGSQSFLNSGSMIGKQVLAPGSSLVLPATGSTDFGVQLSSDSAQTTVQLVAADGTVVDEISLGALTAGSHAFTWDGTAYDGSRAAAGNYMLVAKATDASGNTVTSQPLTYGTVSAVQRSGTSTVLMTGDGRSVNAADAVQFKS